MGSWQSLVQSTFLRPQLLVQDRNIVVVLGLVEVSGHGISQVVLLGKLFDRETTTVISGTIGQAGFVALDLVLLLVDQPHVPVEASLWWGSRSYVLGQGLSLVDLVSGHVDYQVVVPLPVSGLLAARCVRIGHAHRVEGAVLGIPLDLGQILDLRRCENVPLEGLSRVNGKLLVTLEVVNII